MDILKRFGKRRSAFVIAAAMLIGIVMLLLPSGKEESSDGATELELNVTTYTERLEEKIRALCSEVDGVGNVSVLVTLDCASEKVYAERRDESSGSGSSSYSSDYIIIENKNGTSPVTVTEIYPRIRGVAVVCDGGDTPRVKTKLVSLLSAALGIATSRISVSS